MKRIIFSLIMAVAMTVPAAAQISFRFAAGTIQAGRTKTGMEQNITKLLNAINNAGSGRLDLYGISMEENAKSRLKAIWEILPFECANTGVNISKCLHDFQGYQVRSIKITMKPRDNTYTGSIDRELTISLNRQGVITGVRPALEGQEDVATIMGNGVDVEDIECRREILKWVEDFRNYYESRDLKSLDMIFSEEALIITGSVQRKSTANYETQVMNTVKYTKQNKAQYMENLKSLFNRVVQNPRGIQVKFDKISVVRNGASGKEHIYGVTLHQTWKSVFPGHTYQDEGWLFLVWNFKNRNHPEILVRTWQQDQVVKEQGTFTLDDFHIPSDIILE